MISARQTAKKIPGLMQARRTLSRRNVITQLDETPQESYAQCGEDMIMRHVFNALGVRKPSYIDVGAYNPFRFSNTAYFYNNGSRGINIEANPELYKQFRASRPKDINLNIGIGPKAGKLDFYIVNPPTLSTFSKSEAKRYEKEGASISQVVPVKVETFNTVLAKYAKGKMPDFLSIDAEGVDYAILTSIDFKKSRPLIICIETISYSTTGNGVKDTKLIDYLVKRGYLLYADTNINTIFVDEKVWTNRAHSG